MSFNSIEWIRVKNFIRLYLSHNEFLSIPLNGFQTNKVRVNTLKELVLSIPLNGFRHYQSSTTLFRHRPFNSIEWIPSLTIHVTTSTNP